MGSYILISPQPELVVGTYAIHVVNKTWEKIHDENLPFVGQALPIGGSLFAACPISNNSITASASASVFHMSIKVPPSTLVAAVSNPSLSIQEFKVVASEDKIPWPLFCPMGKDSFCFIRLGSSCRRQSRKASKKLKVSLTALWIENTEAIMTHCQSQGAKAKDLLVAFQVKEQSHKCKSKGLFGMSVVAAFSIIEGPFGCLLPKPYQSIGRPNFGRRFGRAQESAEARHINKLSFGTEFKAGQIMVGIQTSVFKTSPRRQGGGCSPRLALTL
ncbi:hypothetical protein SEVIR_8G023501v4 [Setaria viridis]